MGFVITNLFLRIRSSMGSKSGSFYMGLTDANSDYRNPFLHPQEPKESVAIYSLYNNFNSDRLFLDFDLFLCSSSSTETSSCSNDNVENTILIQFLANPSNPDSKYYTVIKPEASLKPISTMGNEYEDSIKAAIIGKFSTEDYDFGSLVDRLFELNENPVELTINSSLEDGYYIDYTHKFERYFQRGGGGWFRWRIFNPQAGGSHQVSIPPYDPNTGYVLMYYGFQGDWLFGGGSIIAFPTFNEQVQQWRPHLAFCSPGISWVCC